MQPSFISSFVARPPSSRTRRASCGHLPDAPRLSAAPTMLSRAAIVDRSYQLEELEDAGDTISALYLSSDGSVSHGRTDGPVPDSVAGEWIYDEGAKALTLQLERRFKESGVDFTVTRVLAGHLDAKDQDNLAMFAGNIYQNTRDIGDKGAAVGHFSMCVATDDLPTENYDITGDN